MLISGDNDNHSFALYVFSTNLDDKLLFHPYREG